MLHRVLAFGGRVRNSKVVAAGVISETLTVFGSVDISSERAFITNPFSDVKMHGLAWTRGEFTE